MWFLGLSHPSPRLTLSPSPTIIITHPHPHHSSTLQHMAVPSQLYNKARPLPRGYPVEKSISNSSWSGASDSDDLRAPGLTSGASHHSSSALEDELSTDVSPTSPTFEIPDLPCAGLGLTLGKTRVSPLSGISIVPFPSYTGPIPPSRSASPARSCSSTHTKSSDLGSDGYDSGYEEGRSRSASRQRNRHHHQPRVVVYHSDSDSDNPSRPAFTPRQSRTCPSTQIARSPSLHRRDHVRIPSPLGTPQEPPTPKLSNNHALTSNRYLQVPEANGEQQLAAALQGLGIRRVSMPADNRLPAAKLMSADVGLGISGLSTPFSEHAPNSPPPLPERKSKKAALSNAPRRPSGPPALIPRTARTRTRNVSPLTAPHVPTSPPIPPRLRGSPLLAQLRVPRSHQRVVSAPVMPTQEDMMSLMMQDGRMHKHKLFAPDSPREKTLKYVVTPPPTGKAGKFDGETTVDFNPYFNVSAH
ncbi:hypothetical protein CALCODRAFT_9150 [Calocera cornea HHB12733]|uniref:Uncharacterized protein n=1 Tax=Calocera cornea HHB12733 TaxID=1353952 RepID=A0A165J5H2_9BASI|nr:hypothetical protein CALCODRAFT_9150 [Calocera cornea HHB12733]